MFGRQELSCSFTSAINPLGKDFPQTNGLQNLMGEDHFQTKSLKIDATKTMKNCLFRV
jgi:hypothetical protein